MGDLVKTDSLTVGKGDALIIVDMQNDFIPKGENNPDGRLGAPEGDCILNLIVSLANKFYDNGGVVVATRDYHPVNHCSFNTEPAGGLCPPHCIQGDSGSFIHKTISEGLENMMLRELGAKPEDQRVHVVFKGFHPDVESFGSFAYSEVPPKDRGAEFVADLQKGNTRLYGCCSMTEWTGCICLPCSAMKRSNFDTERKVWINAPPDTLAAYEKDNLQSLLQKQGIKRVFVCGLVFDLCVTDTAINAAKNGFGETFILMDASRPIYMPGIGPEGSGFLYPVAPISERFKANKVTLIPSKAVLPDLVVKPPEASTGGMFPDSLGPFDLLSSGLLLTLHFGTPIQWSFSNSPPWLKDSATLKGLCGPKSPITVGAAAKAAMSIPVEATSFLWANPLNLDHLDDGNRAWISKESGMYLIAMYGGFIYLDKDDKFVEAKKMQPGKGMVFGAPQDWKAPYSIALEGRWSPPTIPFLQKKGVKLFSWINPNEVLKVAGKDDWKVEVPHGGYAYLWTDDIKAQEAKGVFFALQG